MKQRLYSQRLYPQPGQVDQVEVDGLQITWNPDDSRYYVEKSGNTIASYKDWRNATLRLRKEIKK